jgi:hypothetical protein
MNTQLDQVLSTLYKEGMIEWLNAHPEAFDDTVRLALDNRQPFSWRAAWLLWSCMKPNDPGIIPYISDIIGVLNHRKDGHTRELIKILYRMELDEDCTGELLDTCIILWEQIHKNPSVRYNALLMILKIADKHPDLGNELKFLMQSHYTDSLSPGVRHSVNRMIHKFLKERNLSFT